MAHWTGIAVNLKLNKDALNRSESKGVDWLLRVFFGPKGALASGRVPYGTLKDEIFDSTLRDYGSRADIPFTPDQLITLNCNFQGTDPTFQLYDWSYYDIAKGVIEGRSNSKRGDNDLSVKFFSWLNHLGVIDTTDNPIVLHSRYSNSDCDFFIGYIDGELRVGEWFPFHSGSIEHSDSPVYLDNYHYDYTNIYPYNENRKCTYERFYTKKDYQVEVDGKSLPFESWNWSFNTGEERNHLASSIGEFDNCVEGGTHFVEDHEYLKEEYPYCTYYLNLIPEAE